MAAAVLPGARTWQDAWVWGTALACVVGCAGAPTAKPQAARSNVPLVRPGTNGGPDLALIARPSAGSVQLSLFVDAGARDADPPQVATLAAWLAADAAGKGVEGWASPDGIELSLLCPSGNLAECLARLARGLALRSVRPASFTAASQRLVRVRRQADASDPGRSADRLALQALYGPEAKGLIPMGDAAGDVSLSAARVEAFLAQHFGLGRLLLVAAGELDGDELARAAKAAFSRTPRALSPRDPRRAGPSDEGGVQVGVDDKPALSLAVTAPDVAQALSGAAALEARLARDALASVTGGHAFMLRGAAVALLRLETRSPLLAVRAAAQELERVRREPPVATPAPPSGDQLSVQTRRLGTRWFAGEPPRTLRLALGVGMLVAGGRGDRTNVDDPDAALREDMQRRAQAAWKEGSALGDPRPTGSSDEQSASVALENGARIELRRRESEQIVVAVRFAPGASAEPPLLHSRTALLATLTATTCAEAEPRSRLQPIGVTLEPRVDAYSWGLLLTAPSGAWQAALSLALDCALHPALERQQLAAARLVLRERLGPQLGPEELRAAAAEVLSPGAPGLIAPWGSPFRQASVSLSALRELWSQSRSGSNVTVSAVGPLPVPDAVGWIARRLSELSPRRATPESPVKAATATQAAEAQRIISPTLGLALWRAPLAGGADPAGALAFAASMRAELASTGMTTSWHAAGVTADGGWAAVSVGGPAEDLALVSARLRETSRSLPSTSLERAVDQAFELAERARASDAGNAAAEAEALAKAPYAPPPAKASREAARALALRLAQAEPIWLPLR